jgi:hypothetical protein
LYLFVRAVAEIACYARNKSSSNLLTPVSNPLATAVLHSSTCTLNPYR